MPDAGLALLLRNQEGIAGEIETDSAAVSGLPTHCGVAVSGIGRGVQTARARSPENGGVTTRPQLTAAPDRAAEASRRWPRQRDPPDGAEHRTAPRAWCRSPRYEQPSCQSPLSACKHPNPDAVRKRSQAPRLGADGELLILGIAACRSR